MRVFSQLSRNKYSSAESYNRKRTCTVCATPLSQQPLSPSFPSLLFQFPNVTEDTTYLASKEEAEQVSSDCNFKAYSGGQHLQVDPPAFLPKSLL